jgi:Mce-associated membrane protein
MGTAGGTPVDVDLFPSAPGLPGQLAPPYASWGRRVVAAVLDGAIGAGVTFLALNDGAVSVPFFGAAVLYTRTQGMAAWTDSGWVVAAAVVMVTLQAYLGVTPGKLVVGIAVVRDGDARPIGLVRTLLRWLAHLFDAILMIGFLRPLWNPRHQTFADSWVGTLVLVTSRPRPHRWFAGRAGASLTDPGPPESWEAPSARRWWPVATALAAVVCLFGVLFAYGPETGRAPNAFGASCTMTAVDDGAVRLTGGTLSADAGGGTTTRLWVTRPAGSATAPMATWVWTAPVDAPNDVVLRASFVRADGTGVRHFDFPLSSESDSALGTDTSVTMTLPADALAGLGSSWTSTQTLIVDGVESPGCVVSPSEPGS